MIHISWKIRRVCRVRSACTCEQRLCCHFIRTEPIRPPTNKRKILLRIQSSKSITFPQRLWHLWEAGWESLKQNWKKLGSSLASHSRYNISMRKGAVCSLRNFTLLGGMNSFCSLSMSAPTDTTKTLSQVISPLNLSFYQKKKKNFNFQAEKGCLVSTLC